MKTFNKILTGIQNSSVLVIGDIMIDKYTIGKSTRLSPEFPVPVINFSSEKTELGGSINVAKNLSSIGVKTSICGIIGSDNNGELVIKKSQNEKIDTEMIFRRNQLLTTTKERIISNNSHIARLDKDIERVSLNEIELSELIKKIPEFDLIIISDHNKGLITKKLFKEVHKVANEHDIKIYVDPKQNPEVYKNANFITPNEKELEQLFLSNLKNLKKIITKFNFDGVVVTMGDKGYFYFDKNNKEEIGSAQKVDVFDVCGAGDTFISYFSIFTFLTKDITMSLKIASAFASLTVTHNGVYAPNIEDFKNIISDYL